MDTKRVFTEILKASQVLYVAVSVNALRKSVRETLMQLQWSHLLSTLVSQKRKDITHWVICVRGVRPIKGNVTKSLPEPLVNE